MSIVHHAAVLWLMFLITATPAIGQNKNQAVGKLINVSADSSKGFSYDYLLYIPPGTSTEKTHFLLVEPNNSGFPDDSMQVHEKHAKQLASVNSSGNYVVKKLKIPFLVPIFPRPANENLIYTHALDRDAILKKDSKFSRLDLQLVKMIEHSKNELAKVGIKTRERVFLNGFSASGTFVNRFVFLHPQMVEAVAAGGLNGILMLPEKNIRGENLDYPLGLNDFEEITSEKFDIDAYRRVPQFLYMGAKDTNDAVKYDDAYSAKERKIVYKTLGQAMQPDRWKNCQEIYQRNQINVEFTTYNHIGHGTDNKVLNDIVSFFEKIKPN
jgi:hypothetical protein